jgi:SAM-dependent methyltransferase
MREDVRNLGLYYPRQTERHDDYLDRLGWPSSAADLAARYCNLLSPIDFSHYSVDNKLRLLDLGCGFGLLLDYLKENNLLDIVDYTGVDLLEKILVEARERWPDARFELRDVRDEPYPEGAFDYCIICGVFTSKLGNSYAETVTLVQETLKSVWPSVTVGLGFNSISKHVDWERQDLFHWPIDDIMAFCKRDLSRHVSFMLDYGPWEISTLVRKSRKLVSVVTPADW